MVVSEIAIGAAGICTGLGLALLIRSSWAVIINILVFSILRMLSTYWIHPHRPRPTLRLKPLAEFLGFGIYYNLANAAGCLTTNLDRLIIGRLLGLHPLGLYDRASMLGTSVKMQLVRFLAAVVFPGFSHLLDRPERFRQVARKYVLVLGSLCLTAPLILFPFSDLLVRIIMGPRFLEAIPIFRILLFSTAFHGFAIGIQFLFVALGRPRYFLHANLAQLGTLIVALPLGIGRMGIEGACWGVLAADAANLLVTAAHALRGGLLVTGGEARAEAKEEVQEEALVS